MNSKIFNAVHQTLWKDREEGWYIMKTTTTTTTTIFDAITAPISTYTRWDNLDLWKKYNLAGLTIAVGNMSYKDKDMAPYWGVVEVYKCNSWQEEFFRNHGWTFGEDKDGVYAHFTAYETREEWEEAQNMVLKAIFGQPLEWRTNNSSFDNSCTLRLRKHKDNTAVFFNEENMCCWKTSQITNIVKDYVHGVILVTTNNSDYQGSLPLHICSIKEDNQIKIGRGGKLFYHFHLSRPARKEEVEKLLKSKGYKFKQSQGWWDDGSTLEGKGTNWTYCWEVAYTD